MKQKIFSLLSITLLLTSSVTMAMENIVNIYTYHSFASEKWGAGQKLKLLFEKQYPHCQINYTTFDGSNTMFNRIRLEGKQIKADMVIGLNNFMLDAAEKSRLFTSTKIDLSALPAHFRNLTFIPYGFAHYAFIYDKNKLKNPPKSLQELVERQDIRVIYEDPRTSAVGQGFVVWMNKVYSADTIQKAWQTLAKHTVTVTKSWSEAYGAFLKGEADLVLSYNTSPLYHLLNEHHDRYIATNFPPPQVPQIEFIATLKHHENVCTESFTQFLITPEAQKILSIANVMLPVVQTIQIPLYDDLRQKTTLPTIDTIPQERIRHWIDVWQNTLTN